MRKLLIYMKDYKKESVLAPLFKLLEASFELLVPLVMARIIDRGIGNGDKHYVTIMCLLMVSRYFPISRGFLLQKWIPWVPPL